MLICWRSPPGCIARLLGLIFSSWRCQSLPLLRSLFFSFPCVCMVGMEVNVYMSAVLYFSIREQHAILKFLTNAFQLMTCFGNYHLFLRPVLYIMRSVKKNEKERLYTSLISYLMEQIVLFILLRFHFTILYFILYFVLLHQDTLVNRFLFYATCRFRIFANGCVEVQC